MIRSFGKDRFYILKYNSCSKAYLQTNVDFLQLVHFRGYFVSFLWNFDNTKDIDRYVVSEGDWMKKI